MPPPACVRRHEEANLSRGEQRELIDGFERTFAADPARGGHDDDDDDDEEGDD
jgi:hypothetical protein